MAQEGAEMTQAIDHVVAHRLNPMVVGPRPGYGSDGKGSSADDLKKFLKS